MSDLFYVMGASGAGKDTLFRYARKHISQKAPVVFAHRYITRGKNPGGENHIALSEKEFQLRLDNGLFSMHWESHGLFYGIGIEIDMWLKKGLHVVVNGSRGYLDKALNIYPGLRPVLIRVSPEILERRLRLRGRENEAEIKERLERARAFEGLKHPRLIIIDNNGPIETSGEEFTRIFSESKFL